MKFGALRKNISLEKIMEKPSGWFEKELYDADSFVRQEVALEKKGIMHTIYMLIKSMTPRKQ